MEKVTRKPEKIFLILASLFIGITIFLMPISKVPDEVGHARMTWDIFHEKTDKSFDWMKFKLEGLEVNREEYKQAFTNKIDVKNEKTRFSFPLKRIMHVPQLIGMMIGKFIYPSVGVIITFGRITNALFYIIMMYFIIKYMKYGKLALVFLGLMPIMIQQAASLSYDVMNFIVIFGFFAILSNLSIDRIITKTKLFQLIVITIGLYVTKMNNLVLLLLLLPLNLRLPDRFIRTNKCLSKLESIIKKYKYVVLGLGLALGFLLAVIYLRNKGGITNFIQVMLNTLLDNKLNPHLNTVLTTGMFGFIGSFEFQIPMWLIMVDVAVLTILLMKKEKYKLNKVFGISSGLMTPLQVAMIIGGMYFAWTPIAVGENALISQGAQGRYFTPFLIFLVPLFISYKDKLTVEYSEKSIERLTVITLIVNFVIMAYLMLLIYWYPLQEAEWLINLRKTIGG